MNILAYSQIALDEKGGIDMIDLSGAGIYTTPYMTQFEKKIVNVFCDDILEKSGIDLRNHAISQNTTIEFYNEDNLSYYEEDIVSLFSGISRPGKEGFRIKVLDSEKNKRIIVLGKDERGEFYGMARILRNISAKKGIIMCSDVIRDISMTPEYPLRGHQLGYRDKNNTYSAWTIQDYEHYIRDMALFGANAIELLPPKTDDALFSSTFVEDPFELMIEVSKIIHSYNMDVWLWYPNVGEDYDNLDCMYRELKEREKVFSAIPYLDAILVPLGDPGSLWPAKAMKVTEEFVKIMHQYHPSTGVWVAPQHFQPEPGWYDEFYDEIGKQPDWVTGICFAPWEQHEIMEMQDRLPQKYKYNIRNYPDISHNTNCQFPVPMWDNAFALTLGREGNNARPKAMKHIHNMIEPYTCGTITYSEGIHDDINKIVWCDQDFDSKIEVSETLKDYVRLFIDADITEELADLILRAEDDWVGPILENDNIDTVYADMRKLDSLVSEKTKENYRYQMIKLRIYTDYWTKYKYSFDKRNEKKAREIISCAQKLGSKNTIKEARSILNLSKDAPAMEELLKEMQKLSDSLYQKCRIQLTVTQHHGQRWIRGAYLETAHMPLNEYQYLMMKFRGIEKIESEEERIQALLNLNARENPGDGNIYCCLGSEEGFSHVTQWRTWEEDPGYLKTPVKDHSIYSIMGLFHQMDGWYYEFPMPLTWAWNATVLYGTPLEVRFDGLDPDKKYILKAFYPNTFLKAVHHMQKPEEDTECNLWAGDELLASSIPRKEMKSDVTWDYELPQNSYATGTLKLRWQVYGTLKAFAVSEIWIIQKD